MKIQCDVCGKEEASVFCCADEAALCNSCDHRVHRANKLAGKHRRFSLIAPSSPSLAPRCDVCQEKRAFLFCQEDRAILCRDCDGPIHTANDLTMKHNRFLLTGVKLSPSATSADASDAEVKGVTVTTTTSPSSKREELETATTKTAMMQKKKKKKKVENPTPNLIQSQSTNSCTSNSINSSGKVVVLEEDGVSGGAGGGVNSSSSSISDYLMKTLPGWRVDDLLMDFPSPSSPFGFSSANGLSKMGMSEDVLPFVEADLDPGGMGGGDAPVWWVPQVPQVPPQNTTISFHNGGGGNIPSGQQRWRSDNVFTVPQIISQQPPVSNKRSRQLWYT